MDSYIQLVPRDLRAWRLRRAPAVLLATAAMVCLVLSPVQADDEEPQWSVIKPLAVRSLILDVAAVDGRIVAVGERGHVLISQDVGASWTQVAVPTRSALTGLCLIDASRGWAAGHDGVILRTSDGGVSWERVHWAPEEEAPLFDVWFSSPLEGFAMGAYGTWYVTEDGGSSWLFEPISDDDSHLHKVSQADDGRLYLAAERGMLYRSDDGGASWIELPSPYEGSFFGALPVRGDEVLVFGLRGHLFRSEDAGESWAAIDTGTTTMLTDGVVMDDGTVVIVGLGGTALVSADQGQSFVLTTTGNRQGINAVVESAPGVLTIVGEFGVRTLPAAELVEPGRGAEGEAGR